VRLLVWGLGYVGTVSAACLAKSGHEVVGIEPNDAKVAALQAGRSPVKEPGIDAVLVEALASGTFRATSDASGLVAWADASLVCVGTPSGADSNLQLDALTHVATEIGGQIGSGGGYHVVIVRSTVTPGTVRDVVRRAVEDASGHDAGEGFGLAMNPEFLRETSAIADFYAPPYTVIGALDRRSADVVESLYAGIPAPVHRVSIEQAEAIKLVCNAFHALKIGFANEVGRVCDALGMDSRPVMELVCADTKLNISPAYLRPGFAFGGSCLPKDLRALTATALRLGVELPMLSAVLPSNRLQIAAAREKIHRLRARRIAVLGLSFKPGTDDVRESPTVDLIRELWQDGLDVVVHDPDIQLDEMLGTNLEYLARQLPQIREIARSSLTEALDGADAVVVSQRRTEFVDAVQRLNGERVVDLVDLALPASVTDAETYSGISW
jgi:GDP-mannose 6-dehydrogenase